jgi:transposase
LAAFLEFLRERVTAFPDLSPARLSREIRELGYVGAYTAVKRYLAAIRPQNGPNVTLPFGRRIAWVRVGTGV